MANVPGPTPLQIPYAIARHRDSLGNGAESIDDSGITAAFQQVYKFLESRSYRRVLLIAGAGGVIFAAWCAYCRITREDGPRAVSSSLRATYHEDQLETKNREEAKIVLHCNSRGYFTPAIGVQPLQLETFLRVAGLSYDVSFANEHGSYDTSIMTFGDRSGGEFRDCVRILAENFDINLEKDVPSSRKTASHLVDISLENQFSWAILIWRWIHDGGNSMRKIQAINPVGDEVVGEVANKVKAATRFHPIGQLDRNEFVKTINQGIHDISAALGKHKFFQGNSPGIVDCHAFAIFVQMMWNMPGSPFEQQLKRFNNLLDFIRRMKDAYWPDWNNLILKPKEFEEMYNATYRSRSASKDDKNRRRSSARSRSDGKSGQGEHDDDSSYEQNTDDGASGKSPEQKRKISRERTFEVRRKVVDPEALKLIVKKDGIANDNGERGNQTVYQADSITANQPQGILKINNNVTNPNPVEKPRSGLVNPSGAQSHFPVQEIVKASEPTSSNRVLSSVTPSERDYVLQNPSELKQQDEGKEDSLTHVHRPSVKFANAPSAEYTAQQNLVNGNERILQSQIPIRKAQPHPASASELSNRNALISSHQTVVEQVPGNDNLDQQKQEMVYADQLDQNEHILRGFTTMPNMIDNISQGQMAQQIMSSNTPPQQLCSMPNASPPPGSPIQQPIQQGECQLPQPIQVQQQQFNSGFKHINFNQNPPTQSSFPQQQQFNQNNGQEAQAQQQKLQFNGNTFFQPPQQQMQFQFSQNAPNPTQHPFCNHNHGQSKSYSPSTPQPVYLNPPRPLYLNQTVGTPPVQFRPQAQFGNSIQPSIQLQQSQSTRPTQPPQQQQQQQPFNPSMMSQGQFPQQFQNGYMQHQQQNQQQPQQGYEFQGGQPVQGQDPNTFHNRY